MHIGIVAPFNCSHAAHLLHPNCREEARATKGRTNTPVLNLLEEYLRTGCRVSIFTFETTVDRLREFHCENLSIYVLPHRCENVLVHLDHFSAERKRLVTLLHRMQPDVVHSHWTHTGHALAALESGLPCLCTIRDTALRYAWLNRGLSPTTIFYQINSVLYAAEVIRRATHLSAVSEYTARHIKDVFRFKGSLDVVPNAVLFDSASHSEPKHPFNPNAPVFIDISSWGRLKNVTTLLGAFSNVLKLKPDARLILYGAGLEVDGQALSWARDRNMDRNVEFRGFAPVSELNMALRHESDIFVHLSAVETFGNSICEAVAAGNPAVISNQGAGQSVLKNSGSCRYVPPTSVAEAAKAMLDLTENYDLSLSLLHGLQTEIHRDYCPERVVGQYMDIYKKILGR